MESFSFASTLFRTRFLQAVNEAIADLPYDFVMHSEIILPVIIFAWTCFDRQDFANPYAVFLEIFGDEPPKGLMEFLEGVLTGLAAVCN